ncbi:hypothetical protein [Iodobacter sp.]|uniref:hypothetical protein n=1 Tax=Iodobacter sp. TaxID=1915058 RepID=UPI0025D782C8|nr:hypothetical protein [Iodobacter sp.]
MAETLEVSLGYDRQGVVLVQIESALGNGQTVYPKELRALARALECAAAKAETLAKPGKRVPRQVKGRFIW